MRHIIYKVTNIVNNKYYIGYHKTDNIHDDYYGSGKLLKTALNKYGKKNFNKEILFIFDNKEQALLKEFELVNDITINDVNSYNLKIGGEGGWDYINNVLKDDLEYRKAIYIKSSNSLKESFKSGKLDHLKKAMVERNKKMWIEGKNASEDSFYKNRKLSQDHKDKISGNNGNKLSIEEKEKRLNDLKVIDKEWGYISKLAKLWDISHTQVKRFLKNVM